MAVLNEINEKEFVKLVLNSPKNLNKCSWDDKAETLSKQIETFKNFKIKDKDIKAVLEDAGFKFDDSEVEGVTPCAIEIKFSDERPR